MISRGLPNWHTDCDSAERSHQWRSSEVGWQMSQRQSNLLWLKDMIEHLSACQQQLQWAEDPDTIQLLAETMLRDLECCRRICETVRRRTGVKHAA